MHMVHCELHFLQKKKPDEFAKGVQDLLSKLACNFSAEQLKDLFRCCQVKNYSGLLHLLSEK